MKIVILNDYWNNNNTENEKYVLSCFFDKKNLPTLTECMDVQFPEREFWVLAPNLPIKILTLILNVLFSELWHGPHRVG